MTELTSAPVPPLAADDHVRSGAGDGAPEVVMYADFTCPHCAVAHERLREAGARVVFRHFALKAKHPRAPVLACAAEAAALQGAFWPMHDALYADQGHQDDPHLWERAAALGLDVARFDEDRRSDAVVARVKRDVHDALRAGAATTPTLWIEGQMHAGAPSAAILDAVRK